MHDGIFFRYAANWKRYVPQLLELDGCTTSEAEKHVDLVTLIASYYVFCVSYPKSSPAAGCFSLYKKSFSVNKM